MTTNRKFSWKEISHRFKLHRSYSISFNLSKVGEIFGVESERTVSKFRKKENENLCVVFTNSMKWARETRKFHVAVMQRWLKSVMHVQICRFANINLRIFLPFSLPSPWSLLKFRIAVIQTFCYHSNVTSHFIASVSLGVTLTPERNWRQCLCKILEWQSKSIMVCYGIFCSGQLQTPWMKRNAFSVTFRLSTLDWWNVLCLVWCLLSRSVYLLACQSREEY